MIRYEQAYTKERKLSTPGFSKSPQIPHKSPQRHINTPKVLDIHSQASYNNSITLRSRLMSVAFHQAQKQKYRVTLEFEVLDDFDPHNLDWEKVFHLEPAEKVSAYVEDLSTPDRW
jgi:predicted component of type VI protein secretion system